MEAEVQKVRKRIAETFLSGFGVEVGAGSRPFPLSKTARAIQGDIRDKSELCSYFSTIVDFIPEFIDAQSFAGVTEKSLDFVISAHVIEHLRDPVGAIVNAIRVLKRKGIFILVAPDRRHTFDKRRPNTSVQHVISDFNDGGEGSTKEAYKEHLTYVHPFLTGETYSEEEIERMASLTAENWMQYDVHFHAWDRDAFRDMLVAIQDFASFRIIHEEHVFNENIFVLQKRGSLLNFLIKSFKRGLK